MVRCIFSLVLLVASPAWAAGFFRPGLGVGNLGAGGTGVSSGAVGYGHWYNPAMLSLTRGKAELTLDWTVVDEGFSFKRSREGLLPAERLQADADSGGRLTEIVQANCCDLEPKNGQVDAAANRQIPFLGVAFPVRQDLVLGLAIYGPHGPRRDMPKEGSQRYAVVETNITLAIAQVSVAYGKKNWGVGLGLTNFWLSVDQTFTLSADLNGLEDPAYDAWAAVSVEDQYIPVANIGFWAVPMPGLRVGASFQKALSLSCIGSGTDEVCGHVVASGTITPELAPGLDSLATVSKNDGGSLVMKFPNMLRLGAAQKVGKSTEVSIDAFYEAWGSMGNLTFVPNNVAFEINGTNQEIVLANIVFPRRWKDTYGVRFGTRYDLPKRISKLPVQLRFGGMWESSATPLVEIDPGALDWEKVGFTVGLGVEPIKGLIFDAYFLRTMDAELTVSDSNMRTANIFHADQVAAGNAGLETVAGNGIYKIDHQRFGFGMRYALGVN